MHILWQALLQSIKSLEADLEVAVDEEEYDDAATISEQVDDLNEQLDNVRINTALSDKQYNFDLCFAACADFK